MVQAVAFDFGHTLLDERAPDNGHRMPGVMQSLDGIPLPKAVWANTRMGGEPYIRMRLRQAGLEHYFQHVATSEEAGARKPHAAFFDYALRQSGWSSDAVLFVGNQLNTDVTGARQYGIRVVWLSDGAYRSLDETMSPEMVKPAYTIATLYELPDLLRKISNEDDKAR